MPITKKTDNMGKQTLSQTQQSDKDSALQQVQGFEMARVLSVPENEDWDFPLLNLSEDIIINTENFDAEKFAIKNNKLVTQYSFDYEDRDRYYLSLDSAGKSIVYQINITDVKGVFDENGIATKAVAAKYPHVNEGDYIYWNYTWREQKTIYDNSKITVSYPNKILIHSKQYKKITIDLSKALGNSTNEKVVVTNFLGQVEFEEGLALKNAKAIRITGKYDKEAGTGHKYFKGLLSTLSFYQGNFGLYGNNNWKSEENYHLIDLNTITDKIEIDNVELANGAFSAINWKNNNDANYSITDSSTVHHCYIHDIGSEGLYIGSTGKAPQQVFKNLVIERNIILRCGGEGIQLGWQLEGCIVRQNTVHSGLDWKHPFMPYQDGVMQLSTFGKATVEQNIFMGGGESLGIIELKGNITPHKVAVDTVLYKTNLIYGIRGGMLTHFIRDDGKGNSPITTPVVFDHNFYKQIGEDYFEVGLVNGKLDTTQSTIFDFRTFNQTIIARNNVYDYSVENLVRKNSATPSMEGNKQKVLPVPQFKNYLGFKSNFNYLKISRYTDSTISYQPKRKKPAKWKVGDVVQYYNREGKTRFFKCIKTHNLPHKPDSGNINKYWQLLTWQHPNGGVSYFPPDDVRLKPDSFYEKLGMGVGY